MNKILGCVLTVLLISLTSEAQVSRYIIKFKDKATNPFNISNPSAYLSQKAIDRRIKYAIVIDSTDLPVTPRYIDSIRLSGSVTILNTSKWLNAVSIQTTDAAALTKINGLPFVKSVSGIALRIAGSTASSNTSRQTAVSTRQQAGRGFKIQDSRREADPSPSPG